MASATAPAAPGRLGQPLVAQEALRYLEALGEWRDQRKAELDLLDQAALAAPDQTAFTGDMLLSMALWKAVADRHDLLLATWDSGRVGQTELERLSTLVWGRLDATMVSRPQGVHRCAACRRTAAAGALAVSLPEACRLSDALAASLRARLGIDPSQADIQARVRTLRASVERVRDLVDREPAQAHAAASSMLARLDGRVADVLSRVQRGADVGGLLGPLEHDAARAERDLIVGASNRRADAHDEARAKALRAELEARGAALRDLAARCVAQVAPAPRLAVPDVSALGPVPTDPAAVDAYLVRLDAVGRAMTVAQDAYASALSERDELRGRLGAYAAKAASLGASSPHPGRTSMPPGTWRSSSGEASTRSTVSRWTSTARGLSSRHTRPIWAAPRRRPSAEATRTAEGNHEYDRLRPARLHGCDPRRVLRRLRCARPFGGRLRRRLGHGCGGGQVQSARLLRHGGRRVLRRLRVAGGAGRAVAERLCRNGPGGRRPEPRRPCRAPRTGSPRRPSAPHGRVKVAARSRGGSERRRRAFAALDSVRE